MKPFISDLIPKIQRFSQKLDNLTLLTNQHWVAIDDIDNKKIVYIFRSNNELLISQNGIVERAKWEYLGNNSLLIEKKSESYLFRHGFFDENILALKVDGKEEYVFLINENNFEGELNSLNKITAFLTQKYIAPQIKKSIRETTGIDLNVAKIKKPAAVLVAFNTDKGEIEIEMESRSEYPAPGNKALLNGINAADGKYKFGLLWYIHIKNGTVSKVTLF
jgi:hypothetical protein